MSPEELSTDPASEEDLPSGETYIDLESDAQNLAEEPAELDMNVSVIPAEQVQGYVKPWSLPMMEGENVISPVKKKTDLNREARRMAISAKRKREREAELAVQAFNKPDFNDDSLENVEDEVSPPEEVIGEDVTMEELGLEDEGIQPITAEQLAEITEAAEREGFLKGQQQGYEKGYSEGKDQGYNEGKRLAEEERVAQEAEFESVKERFMQLAETLNDPITEQDNHLEQMLLNTISSLTKSIVQRELQTDSSHTLQLIQKSLGALPIGAKNITMILNPDDLALVETWAEERGHQWAFRADSDMSPGGCKLATSQSFVDFSVEKRLAEVLKEFDNLSQSSDVESSQFIDNLGESQSEPETTAEVNASSEVADSQVPLMETTVQTELKPEQKSETEAVQTDNVDQEISESVPNSVQSEQVESPQDDSPTAE